MSVLVKGVWLMYMNAGGLFVGLPQPFLGRDICALNVALLQILSNSSWFICAWVVVIVIIILSISDIFV